MLKGLGVSPGIAIGSAYVFQPERETIRKFSISTEDVDSEIERFHRAMELSEQQLIEFKFQLGKKKQADHIHIFDAHLLILHDQYLWDDIFELMRVKLINLEWALDQTRAKYSVIFSQLPDEVFREKKTDIHDVIDRILSNLRGSTPCAFENVPPESIVFAHEVTPSVAMCLDESHIFGLVTEVGGKTSHSAIIARALGIPAIVGLANVLPEVSDGQSVVMDGTAGDVILRPSGAILKDYRRRQKRDRVIARELLKIKDLPAETTDGYRVELAANIELLREIPLVKEHGAEAVGLYRTEFLYMRKDSLPDEEEHFRVYRQLASAMHPRPAVIRSFDAGGDKFFAEIPKADSMRDFMGLRAIRLCLKQQDLFRSQLRGIVRANEQGNLKLMFPMISGLEELQEAKAIYFSIREELSREGHDVHDMELGIMIEVPSAAVIADILAPEVDFFSIGTNDLIQYSLAIDRVNKEVAYLYEPLHPSILRTIFNVVQIAHDHDIWVGVCGEMAGDPVYTPVLLGMGIDELSMNATSIPRVKRIIRGISFQEARQVTDAVLHTTSVSEIKRLIVSFFESKGYAVPSLMFD